MTPEKLVVQVWHDAIRGEGEGRKAARLLLFSMCKNDPDQPLHMLLLRLMLAEWCAANATLDADVIARTVQNYVDSIPDVE